MMNAIARIATAETTMMAFERVGRPSRDWTKGGIQEGSDLSVEEVLGGLDGLGADLRGELHGELGALDGHDDGGGVGRLAGGQGARGRGGLLLVVGHGADRLAEHVAEAVARRGGAIDRAGAADRAHAADLPLGAADREGGIDRHQRRRSRVLENICLADCSAVTFASCERDALIRSTISVTESTFGMAT